MTVTLLITLLATAGLPSGSSVLPAGVAQPAARDSLGSLGSTGGDLFTGFT